MPLGTCAAVLRLGGGFPAAQERSSREHGGWVKFAFEQLAGRDAVKPHGHLVPADPKAFGDLPGPLPDVVRDF